MIQCWNKIRNVFHNLFLGCQDYEFLIDTSQCLPSNDYLARTLRYEITSSKYRHSLAQGANSKQQKVRIHDSNSVALHFKIFFSNCNVFFVFISFSESLSCQLRRINEYSTVTRIIKVTCLPQKKGNIQYTDCNLPRFSSAGKMCIGPYARLLKYYHSSSEPNVYLAQLQMELCRSASVFVAL